MEEYILPSKGISGNVQVSSIPMYLPARKPASLVPELRRIADPQGLLRTGTLCNLTGVDSGQHHGPMPQTVGAIGEIRISVPDGNSSQILFQRRKVEKSWVAGFKRDDGL